MSKYFFGNPAYYSNKIKDKSDQERQELNDSIKQRSICFIKSMLADGVTMDDFLIQMEMESNGITLEDLK